MTNEDVKKSEIKKQCEIAWGTVRRNINGREVKVVAIIGCLNCAKRPACKFAELEYVAR